jgi:predicted Mrr-cat superfamily restriction endonuclease
VKDVEASPDGLGLTDPHIIVELKYREGAMGSQVLRSFIAALRPRHKGLYVSTGGFAKEARYEADRANNQVSLIDSDELVNLIIHYYGNFCCIATPFMVLNPNKEPISKWAQGGLNPWPTGYEPVALPG